MTAGSVCTSSERTSVPESSRSRAWSAGRVPSISEITANGSGNASSSIRSTLPPSAMRSSERSTRSVTIGSSAAIALGVNTLVTSARSRVWSGGSRSSMDSARALSSSSCWYWSAIMPPARLRLSTESFARSNAVTSSYLVTSQKPSGCSCTGSWSRMRW